MLGFGNSTRPSPLTPQISQISSGGQSKLTVYKWRFGTFTLFGISFTFGIFLDHILSLHPHQLIPPLRKHFVLLSPRFIKFLCSAFGSVNRLLCMLRCMSM